MELVNPIHLISLLVCIMLIVGVRFRRHRRIHIPLMVSAIVIDLGIVLYIEFSRGAFKAAQAKSDSPFLWVHIAISIVVLVLYAVHFWSGIRLARGGKSVIHGKIMIPTVLLRILNLVTSVIVMGIGT